jgi:predicted esterase
LFFAFLAALAGCAVAAAATGPQLSALPVSTSPLSLRPGVTMLADGSVAYRPASLPVGPRPLVVFLHGAGEPPRMLVERARASADRKGLILLAPKSTNDTWDAIQAVRGARFVPTGRQAEQLFGPDIERIDQAIRSVASNAPVDPRKVIIAGHSDGASYALSLGLWNPRLFRGIIALAPGGLLAPDSKSRSQRIFIAHGRSDPVVSIAHDRQLVADPLTAAGLNVRFREFTGGHAVDVASLDEGIDYVLR